MLTEKEFLVVTNYTDQQAATMFAAMSWNKMLALRSEYTRALDRYAKTHKGKLGGIDQVQLDAIGAIARFDRLLRTYYINGNKKHSRFFGMPYAQAKKIMLGEYYALTKKHY